MGDLRESKKRETRQRISNVATGLFLERGFDAVTIDEVAVAANVSKMTVFNYFARKEDLMLDREDDLKLLFLREALHQRPKGQAPIDALRGIVDRLREQKHPYARVDSQTLAWWRVVAGSPSLEARIREIGDEAADGLAIELAGPTPDGLARLVAGMIVLTWRTAHEEALRVFERAGSAKKASAAFIALIERGFAAIDAMAQAGPPKRRPMETRGRPRGG